MFRYIALTWNEGDANAGATARAILTKVRGLSNEWHCAIDTSGLAVYYADARPGSSESYPLASSGGVVLGKLFKQGEGTLSVAQSVNIDRDEAERIIKSGGMRLIDKYWGRYVAFVRDHQIRTTWVLRDPSGALPCFSIDFRTVGIYFSYTEDYIALGLAPLSLNWKYIAAHVCYASALQSYQTGSLDVYEVQPGECWINQAGKSTKRTWYWDLVQIARTQPIEDMSAAVGALRDTTQMCISAWASCYPRIIHLLSGGLDSSIVVNCMAKAPRRPSVTCLHFFSPNSPLGDERKLAALAAQAAGYELSIFEDRPSEVDLAIMLSAPTSVKPWLMQYHASHGLPEYRCAQEHNAAAISYGVGGDQVFLQGPLELTVVDYMYRHGFTRELMQLASDVSEATGLSTWSLIQKGIKEGWRRPQWSRVPHAREMGVVPHELHRTCSGNEFAYPWAEFTDGVPIGKLEHIRAMKIPEDFYAPLAPPNGPERIRPLLSQPLVALAARIATYTLARNGVDRAVARRAFADRLPQEITRRRVKGVIDEYFQQLLYSNLTFVKELLLDGILVKERMLDARKVEAVLTGPPAIHATAAAELAVYHVGTEAWLQGLTKKRQRAAA